MTTVSLVVPSHLYCDVDHQKLTPLLSKVDDDDAEESEDSSNDAGAIKRLPQPQANYKWKLAFIMLSAIIGSCMQLIATLVVASSSNFSYVLIVLAGALLTLAQASLPIFFFFFPTTLSASKPSTSIVEVVIWYAMSLASYQGGIFFAWVMVQYTLSDRKPRVAFYYANLELLCLSKFMMLAWLVLLEPNSPVSSSADTITLQACPEEEAFPSSAWDDSSEHHDEKHPENGTTAPAATKVDSFKLKLGSHILAYVLGCCAELAGKMIKSSYWSTFFLISGIALTILQAWVALRFFSSSTKDFSMSIVEMTLRINATVFSYQTGYYCACSLTDYMIGQPRQLVLHVSLEAGCIGVSTMAMWLAEAGHRAWVIRRGQRQE